jgi:hypothetical protein
MKNEEKKERIGLDFGWENTIFFEEGSPSKKDRVTCKIAIETAKMECKKKRIPLFIKK